MTRLRWFLAGAFALAAMMKITDPTSFAVSIMRLGVVPDVAAAPIAILLPWVELVTAIALALLPSFRTAASALLLTLILGFTTVLVIGLVRSTAAPCGCFGTWGGFLNHPLTALLRNTLLGVLATALFIRASTPPAPPLAATPRQPARAPQPEIAESHAPGSEA